MPTLPSRDDFRQPGYRPSQNVAGYRAGLLEEAEGQTGRVISQAGAELSRMAAEEQAKIDRTVDADRVTKLMQAELELSKEYQAAKGGDVLAPDYHKTSQDKYQAQIDALSQGLTETQKEAFQQTAKRRAVQFDAGRYTYAVGEAERFKDIQYADRVKVLGDTAAQNYADPLKFSDTITGVQLAVAERLKDKGLSGDKAVVDAEMKKALAGVYGQALDQALINLDTVGANALYARVAPLLTTDQQQSFQSRLKPANDFAEGQKLAVEAHDMLTAGKGMDEIELMLTKKATSPGAYNAAQTIFTNFQQASAKQDAEKRGTVLENFSRLGADGNAMAAVLASPEYGKLTEAQQGEIANYMRENAEQAAQRVKQEQRQALQDQRTAKAERREDIRWADYQSSKQKEAKAFDQFGKMVAVMEQPGFASMSTAELWAKAPEVGKENVVRLLTERDNLKNGTKKFQIDPDILNAAVPKKLWDKGEKDKLMAFKGFIQAGLDDWKQANPGKVPTPDEQRRIANSANTKWVEVKDWWPDEEHPAYAGPPEAWVKQLQDSAKKKGKTLTPEQVNKAWRLQSIQGQ